MSQKKKKKKKKKKTNKQTNMKIHEILQFFVLVKKK